MKIMWRLKFLVTALLLVHVDFCKNLYIARVIDNRVKRCIPISNCPYGHEILPCKFEFTSDICASCPAGFVQPDYLQSTTDLNLTKCFKNQNVDKCRADVLKPSRENSAKVCRGVEFCKCNTDKCFFGDPCACQYRECDMDETMLTNGTCVKCPVGTSRIKCGCGPCSAVAVLVDSRQNVTSGIETLPSTERDTIVTLDHSIDKTQSQGITTHGRAQTTDSTKTVSSNAFIAVVVVLTFFVAVCIVLLLILVRKHRSKTDQDADIIEQGKRLVLATKINEMENNNVVNGNEDNTTGEIENEEKDNVTEQSKNTANDSLRNDNCRQDASCGDNGILNDTKDIEVTNVEELPMVIMEIFDNKKDILFPVEHLDVDRIDIPVGENAEDVHTEEGMKKQNQISFAQAKILDEESLNTNSTFGYTQLTEHNLKPVTQASDDKLDQITEEVSSGFDSEEFPHCSPLSDDNSGSIQTYGELVSVSVSNASTEGTEIITSGLESFHFKLTGQTTPAQRESSQSKQVIVRKHSGVIDSGNEEP